MSATRKETFPTTVFKALFMYNPYREIDPCEGLIIHIVTRLNKCYYY